jgi:squalene-associated FAD-dependent desaturase
VTGETIDNCQHVAMGCCTNFKKFCRLTGVQSLFRVAEELSFFGPDGRRYDWHAGPLPAPLHLGLAFQRLGYLTLREKRAIAWGVWALARQKTATNESFADWLVRHRQPLNAIKLFWEVVLVSALSESLDRIDVGYARKVFVDGFLANREGWKVLIPTRPLDEIYEPIQAWLQARGATVRVSTGVERIQFEGERATATVLRNGERVVADEFVVAVPWDRAEALVNGGLARSPASSEKPGFFAPTESAPISSVHLWFDRPITDDPHAVIVGKTSQWLFQRDPERQDGRASHYYQIVVSASREFLAMDTSTAIEHVRRELASLWPVVNEATLLRGRVVTEHKAVFSPLPGIDSLRPPQQTAIPNLQLAGDWTRTGWPATMEGAVKSGFLAAENVLRRQGRREPIVVPGLPVSRLARWTMRLGSG